MPVITGLLLLAAAVLKASGTPPVAGHGFEHLFWIGHLTIELSLGTWLLSGRVPRVAACLALMLFGIFALVAVGKGIIGQADCGCFGRLAVSPWQTAILDVTIVAGLWRWLGLRRRPRPSPARKTSTRAILAVGLGTCALLLCVGAVRTDRLLSALTSGRIVAPRPQEWKSRPLPIMSDIDCADDLSKGDWLLFFYHASCHDCRARVPRLQQLLLVNRRVVFVAVPPVVGEDLFRREVGQGRFCSLNPSIDWFLRTPLQVELVDGLVRSVE